jgi:sugar lactone lactonase YvrE
MELATTTLARGFAFPECPRWHEGALWFSDQHDGLVYRLNGDGTVAESFAVPGRPSGLGWLPDGDLIIVSMLEHRLYRRHDGELSVHAELGAVHPGNSNDMVVDDRGYAYAGNIGFDFDAGETYRPTAIALVTPDGAVSVAADNVACPNGSVIAPDGKSLIVAESNGYCLAEYDIAADGGLTNRRIFASLGDTVPDGICLDDEGCVWVAAPFAGAAFRVRRGGEIADTAPIHGAQAYACMLGGADGRDLFICCATGHAPHSTVEVRAGRIDVARAPAGRAGRP